jgi:hypothetical protein
MMTNRMTLNKIPLNRNNISKMILNRMTNDHNNYNQQNDNKQNDVQQIYSQHNVNQQNATEQNAHSTLTIERMILSKMTYCTMRLRMPPGRRTLYTSMWLFLMGSSQTVPQTKKHSSLPHKSAKYLHQSCYKLSHT